MSSQLHSLALKMKGPQDFRSARVHTRLLPPVQDAQGVEESVQPAEAAEEKKKKRSASPIRLLPRPLPREKEAERDPQPQLQLQLQLFLRRSSQHAREVLLQILLRLFDALCGFFFLLFATPRCTRAAKIER